MWLYLRFASKEVGNAGIEVRLRLRKTNNKEI